MSTSGRPRPLSCPSVATAAASVGQSPSCSKGASDGWTMTRPPRSCWMPPVVVMPAATLMAGSLLR